MTKLATKFVELCPYLSEAVAACVVLYLLSAWAGTAMSVRGQGPEPRAVAPFPQILPEKIQSGQVSVTPDSAIAGEYGTWTVTYRLGQKVQTGGGIRVQ